MLTRNVYYVRGEAFDVTKDAPNESGFDAWENMTYGGLNLRYSGPNGCALWRMYRVSSYSYDPTVRFN